MGKKILSAIILVLSLVLVLSSCNDDGNISSEVKTTQKEEITTEEKSTKKEENTTVTEDAGHTHSFDEWKIVKAATCTTEGVKERYCSCGEKQSGSVAIVNHSYSNGVCVYCGEKLDVGEITREVTKDEWISIFDSNKYQNYTLEINNFESHSRGNGKIFETNTIIEFRNPYSKITAVSSENYGNGNSIFITEEIGFSSGGIDAINIDYIVSKFYEEISGLDDYGYSKFIFNEADGTYSSLVFEDLDSVTISFRNNQIDTIILAREYFDEDYGNVTYLCSLKISNVNNTPKPEAPMARAEEIFNASVDSINDAIEARRYYQSTEVYDLEESVAAFNSWFDTFDFGSCGIERFTLCEFDETYNDIGEHYEYYSVNITIYCTYGTPLNIFGDSIYCEKIYFDIDDGKITSMHFYNGGNEVFAICFIYE